MNLYELQQLLIECDRTSLELQYAFTETLKYQQILLKHQANLLPYKHLIPKNERCLYLLSEEIKQTNTALEMLHCKIDACLDGRTDIERLLAWNLYQ
ncbi:hypothetical protein [Leptolyngbya sp. PL-A3]|uniref:hypothetical protein n=1 Tax=Leptolyngbya sp. PL-A3 TaxID=2933911 RepID=UPI003298AF3D